MTTFGNGTMEVRLGKDPAITIKLTLATFCRPACTRGGVPAMRNQTLHSLPNVSLVLEQQSDQPESQHLKP
jgi:hypothetical protein